MMIANEHDGERAADDADAQLGEVLRERHHVVGRLQRRPLLAAPEGGLMRRWLVGGVVLAGRARR